MLLLFSARFAHARYSSRMIDRFLNWGDHGKPKSGKIKGRCQPPLDKTLQKKTKDGLLLPQPSFSPNKEPYLTSTYIFAFLMIYPLLTPASSFFRLHTLWKPCLGRFVRLMCVQYELSVHHLSKLNPLLL